jgi:heat shock protein HtpX
MAGFVVFIGFLGWVLSQWLGRPSLTITMLVVAIIYALVGYFASARIALAISGAKPVEKRQAPELYRLVENLSIAAGLPMPKLYIIDDAAPNAFATGRDPQHAVVAVTTGILERLDDVELEGVLAHELSHVGNYDIRLMSIVIVLVTVVSLISDWFLHLTFWGGGGDDDDSSPNPVMAIAGFALLLVAPLVAMLLQLAVSRRREYLADASGALLTRYPDGLASALAKIAAYNAPMKHASSATAHLFIANPLTGKRAANWFSTHPPIEDRIARLTQMTEIKNA